MATPSATGSCHKVHRPICRKRLRMLFLRRARHRATFQMYRVVVLLPERFRGGCSFGADTNVSVSSNDTASVRHGTPVVKCALVERRHNYCGVAGAPCCRLSTYCCDRLARQGRTAFGECESNKGSELARREM